MRITLLGTGDATGTPVIGCSCPTCQDAHCGGKSRRSRAAVLVESDRGAVLIDTGPDLRAQMLEHGIGRIDGVIWTHAHYDHFAGFPEFHRVQYNVDVYGLKETVGYIFDYLKFMHPKRHIVSPCEPFSLIGLEFTLFEVIHPPAKKPVGVIIRHAGKKVVITGDSQRNIPKRSIQHIMDPDLLITDAIVPPTVGVKKHMNTEEASDLAREIGAKEVIFTHLSHFFKPHDEAAKEYPLAYDGMSFEL
ncbi:MAG: phosphoribosyl 1,2-cyclic phosphate phosphodiesterase [Methanolobus sp.]|nr:phosphoribosyl 1,2-cyclic phosphate phosphodiesterase [Methanolobus sp.]MDN5308994.1 phosphoribosyl 1,2-cyclic phosphate phosphodiesterase [Methanolobus sp.]